MEEVKCELCNTVLNIGDHPFCGGDPSKHAPTNQYVIGDDIPGGYVVKHLGPTPIKVYSKTELKRAANERGWTIDGDSPKPYRVQWSGRRKDE